MMPYLAGLKAKVPPIHPPFLQYSLSSAFGSGSKKISGSHRSGVTSVTASTLLTMFCQKSATLRALGKVQEIPMIATALRSLIGHHRHTSWLPFRAGLGLG